MPNIDDVPTDVTHAGQSHNYTGPTQATVALVNVPVDAGMSVVGLNRAAYDARVDAEIAAGRAWTSTDVQMTDPRRPFNLNVPYNQAAGYNYARVIIGARRWYLFIDDLEYASQAATRFTTSVDPFASYPWVLGHSMIERSHAAVAASQGDTYGSQYCEAPEPISAPPAMGYTSAPVLSTTLSEWTVMVISANDLRGTGSSTPYFERHVAEAAIDDAAQKAYWAGLGPLVSPETWLPTDTGIDHGFSIDQYESTYPWHVTGTPEYYTPTVRASLVSSVDGIAQAGGVYLFTPVGFAAWLGIVQAASWVMEGISEIRMVPTWCVSGGGGGSPTSVTPPVSPVDSRWAVAAGIPVFVQNVTSGVYDTTVLAGWRNTYLASVGASMFRKLITSQFTSILVGNGDTTEEYEPDLMPSNGVNVHARTGLAHGETSIRLTVDYNSLGTQKSSTVEIGGRPGTVASGYGRAAANTGSANLGLANSASASYLTREAMWYNQKLAIHSGESKVPMNLGIIGVQSIMQAGTSAAMGALAGGPVGAVAGAVLGGGASLVTAGLSANSSLDMLDISTDGSIDIGSYQLGANGVFNTQSFRTWVQALRAASGRGNGAALASAWRAVTGQAFHVVIATPRPDHVQQLLTTWRRYGYMIGRAFEPPRIDAMTRYTYWKTEGAVITGAIPQVDRQRIAEAFDRGVTVYTSLDDIGVDVSTSNTPTPGFTY